MAEGTFHVNRNTGKKSPCHARPGHCPVGEFHGSEKEVDAYIEKQAMLNATLYAGNAHGMTTESMDDYTERIDNKTVASMYYSQDDNETAQAFNKALAGVEGINPNAKMKDTDFATVSTAIDAAIDKHVDAMSDNDAMYLVDTSNDSYEKVYARAHEMYGSEHEPTAKELAKAQLNLEAERREQRNRSKYAERNKKEVAALNQNALDIMHDKVDFNAIYHKQHEQDAADVKAKMDAMDAQGVKHSDKEYQRLNRLYKKYTTGDMPKTMQTYLKKQAWDKLSPKRQREMFKASDPAILYAPPARLASYMRNTRPSNQALEGLSPDARRKVIDAHKKKVYKDLLENHPQEFMRAAYAGGINENNGMWFANNFNVGHKKNGEPAEFYGNETARLATSFAKNISAAQGKAGNKTRPNWRTSTGNGKGEYLYEMADRKAAPQTMPKSATVAQLKAAGFRLNSKNQPVHAKMKRNSKEDIARRNYNRREYNKYNKMITDKLSNKKNFIDENGRFSPRKQADAIISELYGSNGERGNVALQARLLYFGKDAFPEKTMTLVNNYREENGETMLAQSRYQKQYGEKHAKKQKDGSVVLPQMKRGNNARHQAYSTTPEAMLDAKFLSELHGKQNED